MGAAAARIVQVELLNLCNRCRLSHSNAGKRQRPLPSACHPVLPVPVCAAIRFVWLLTGLWLLHACCGSLLSCRDGRRRFLVLSYFLSIIAFITLFGVLTIPDIAREGAEFVTRLKSDNVWVILVEKMRDGLG